MKHRLRYFGHRHTKMDRDHRVWIPKDWPHEAGDLLDLPPSGMHDLPAVQVFGHDQYEERVRLISECDHTAAVKRRLVAQLAMVCHQTKIGRHSRITVFKDLREFAQLHAGGEIVLAGCGDHFEIWNKENFEAMCKAVQRNIDDFGVL